MSALSAGLRRIVILKQPFSFNKTLKNVNWKNRERESLVQTVLHLLFFGIFLPSRKRKNNLWTPLTVLILDSGIDLFNISNVFDRISAARRLQQLGSVSMCEFCLLSMPFLNVQLWPQLCLIEKVSHHNRTDFVTNGRIYPAMPLQLEASADVCICSVCVFAGFSWGSRQKWCSWPSRTARESWSSWPPRDLPVVSQYKRRRKSSLRSASTLLLISIQSHTVGTYPLHLHTHIAFNGICLSFVPLKNTAEWQVGFCCCFGVLSIKFGWSAIKSLPYLIF